MIGAAKHTGVGNPANVNDPYAGFARVWADAASPITQIGENVGPVGSPTLAWRTFGVNWQLPGQRLLSSFKWYRYSSAIFMPVSIPITRGVNSWLPFTLFGSPYYSSSSKGVIGTARFFQDPITYAAEHWEATTFTGGEPLPYGGYVVLSLCFLFKADNTFKIVSSNPGYSDNLSITVPDIGIPVFFGLKINPNGAYQETFTIDYTKNEARRTTWPDVPLDAKLHGSL